ncbi:diguanylate cyclase [Bacillus sp. AFS002410]|uniref:HD-GYP domain-containing protein n=1 Tax=Bacillus sp. AFS002410 TaxID=2033481 RepID=UPI000BF20B56|nr:HD-GYP domain-containing protein [Bacillus sp. AFS002410]PEJ59093.1 diguanylate cyclase [Bacillus sp. AFS002410]
MKKYNLNQTSSSMGSKFKISLDNTFLFRYVYFVSLILVPLLNYFVYGLTDIELYPLYHVESILLGLGFWNKPKSFLFLNLTVIIFVRLYFTDSILNVQNFIILFFVFSIGTLLSVELVKNYLKTNKKKLDVIISLAKTLESKDPYTRNHSENVARYSLLIAMEMNFTEKQCRALYIGGLLHDIGKIGIPEHILFKNGRLTKEEFEVIKDHPIIGYKTMAHITSFIENGVLDMVLYHHERIDGKGYPFGLSGEEIPIVAKITAIADTFDAMTSNRVYRNKLNFDSVINEITINKNLQFDSDIADTFLKILQREGPNILTKQIDENVRRNLLIGH